MDPEQAFDVYFLVDHSNVLISIYSGRISVEKLQNKYDEAETPIYTLQLRAAASWYHNDSMDTLGKPLHT